ncbi:MAG: hypothetical protein H7329_18000 [Opitutaceae bacterium]|nr:hypothetical protein [Cytophagales bacterium]
MKGQHAFYLFFVYIILQGAFRKWLFPSLGTFIYLFQFVLAFAFYFSSKPKNSLNKYEVKPAFLSLLMLYLGFAVLQMLNFRGTDIFFVQIYGLVMHFAFIPMIFHVPRVLESEEKFDKTINWLTYILIGVFTIGIIQFFSSPGSFINKYATDQEAGTYEIVLGGGGRVRIAGTFSYLATYASFLAFVLHLLLYGLFSSVIKNKFKPIFLIAYAMGFINIFMTGSRGPVGYYVITEGLTVLILLSSGQFKFLNKLIPIGISLSIVYIIIISTSAGSTALGDFMYRFQNSNDLGTRINLLPFLDDEVDLIGYGLGTAQPAMGGYLSNRNEMPLYWEVEYERITLEMGIFGYILIMILRYIVFYTCYTIAKKVKKLEFKILALQMTMFQVPFLLNLQTNIYNYIDGMFYWIAIGIVYFAYYIDLKYNAEQDKLEPTPTALYRWD